MSSAFVLISPTGFAVCHARNRRIAQFLAVGNRTSETAHKFGLCEGRISQIRKELSLAWSHFQGETLTAVGAV